MNRRFFITVFVAATAALGTSAAEAADDGKLAAILAKGTMRVGVTLTSPPWSLLGEDNKPAGYDVEIAREVGHRIGVKNVEFIADSFKNFLEGLRAEKYDVVFNDLTPTPERAKLVDFAEPYGVEDFRIFIKTGNATIKGTADLKGKTVGVSTGTTNDTWARLNLPSSTIAGYENGSFIFQDIGFGRIDATIISHFGGVKYANAMGLAVTEVGEPLTYQLSAPALKQREPSLRVAIDKAVQSMLADGTVDRLADKFVGRDFKMSDAITKAKAEAGIAR